MAVIEIWDEVQCGGGVPIRQVTDWVECRYGESLAGDVGATLVLPVASPALADCAIRNVLRIEDAGIITEYRILRLDDELTAPLASVTCAPILHDLGRAPIVQTISGLQTYSQADTVLTPTQWIDNYVLPSLTTNGISWVARGTISLTGTVTLGWATQTPLGLLRACVANTSYEVSLRRNGATNYLIDLVIIDKTGGVSPVAFVGRNVRSLQRTVDGDPQLTVVVPTGVTPSGGTRPSGIEQATFQVHTEPSGATVKIKDAKTSQPVLQRDDQLNGLYASVYPAAPIVNASSQYPTSIGSDTGQWVHNPDDGCLYRATLLSGTVNLTRFNPVLGKVTGYWSTTLSGTSLGPIGASPGGSEGTILVTSVVDDTTVYAKTFVVSTATWSSEASLQFSPGNTGGGTWSHQACWMSDQGKWLGNFSHTAGTVHYFLTFTDASPPVIATSTSQSVFPVAFAGDRFFYKAGGGGTDRVYFHARDDTWYRGIYAYNPNTGGSTSCWENSLSAIYWMAYDATNDRMFAGSTADGLGFFVCNTSGLIGYKEGETWLTGISHQTQWCNWLVPDHAFYNGSIVIRATADTNVDRWYKLANTIRNYCPYSSYYTGWTAGGANVGATTTDPVYESATGAGTLSRSTADTDHRYAILKPLSGNGSKAVSVYLKPGTSTQNVVELWDSTAATSRHKVRVTWSGGVPTLSTLSGGGTLTGVESQGTKGTGGWYRIKFVADSVVAANTNHLRVYPCDNGTSGGSVYVYGAQVENDSTHRTYGGTKDQNTWGLPSYSEASATDYGRMWGMSAGKTYGAGHSLWWDSSRSRYWLLRTNGATSNTTGPGMELVGDPAGTVDAPATLVSITDSAADDGTGVSTITPANTAWFKEFGAATATSDPPGGARFGVVSSTSGNLISEMPNAGAISTYGRIVGFVDGSRYGFRGERQLIQDPLNRLWTTVGSNWTCNPTWRHNYQPAGGGTTWFNNKFTYRAGSHAATRTSVNNILTNGASANPVGARQLVTDGWEANKWIPKGTVFGLNTYFPYSYCLAAEDVQANGSGQATIPINVDIRVGDIPDNTAFASVYFPGTAVPPSWMVNGYIIGRYSSSNFTGYDPWHAWTSTWTKDIYIPWVPSLTTLRVTIWYGHWGPHSNSWNDTELRLRAGAVTAVGAGSGSNGGTAGVKNLTITQTITRAMCNGFFPISLEWAGTGTVGYVIYGMSAYLGPETLSEPFENSHANDLWQFGGNVLEDVSEPPIAYQLEVLEDDAAAPFALGGTVTLRDPERGIAATPRIVNIERILRHSDTGVVATPIIELENRPQSLVQGLVKKGSV